MIQINRLFIGFSIAFYIFLIVFFGWFYDKNDKNFFKWKEDLAATLEDYKLSDKTIEIFLKTTYFLEEEQYYLIDRITYNNYNDVDDYIINNTLLLQAQRLYYSNKAELEALSKKYNVPSEMVIASYVVNKNLTQLKNNITELNILTNLAFRNNSAQYMQQLIAFLQLIENKVVEPTLFGNIDGTMTDLRIYPMTYVKYIKLKNNSSNKETIIKLNNKMNNLQSSNNFEFIYNLFNTLSIKENNLIIQEVSTSRVSINLASIQGVANLKSIAEWGSLGVRKLDSTPLDKDTYKAGLIFMPSIKSSNQQSPIILYHNGIIMNTTMKYSSIILYNIHSISKDLKSYKETLNYVKENVKSKKSPTIKSNNAPKKDDLYEKKSKYTK